MQNHLNAHDPEFSADLAKYLEQTPEVGEQDLSHLEAAANALDDDPAFQADYLKSLFVEKLLAAMEEQNVNQNQLAQRWGKSRQYVSKLFNEDKRVNFTIETMTELSHLLGLRLDLQVLSPGDYCHVLRCLPSARRLESCETVWDKTVSGRVSVLNEIAEFTTHACSLPNNAKPMTYDADLAA